MDHPRNIEILKVEFPTFGKYRFSAITSYYLLHSPLLNFRFLSTLRWDREIGHCLKNHGSLKTQLLESELRNYELTPYDWLPRFHPLLNTLNPQVFQSTPDAVDFTYWLTDSYWPSYSEPTFNDCYCFRFFLFDCSVWTHTPLELFNIVIVLSQGHSRSVHPKKIKISTRPSRNLIKLGKNDANDGNSLNPKFCQNCVRGYWNMAFVAWMELDDRVGNWHTCI